MQTLIQDLHYGLRMLAKNPGFTAVAVTTLALGIGANTAIFSVVNAVLLQPLPFENPSRLFMIWEGFPQLGFPKGPFSAPDLTVYEHNQRSFESIGAFQNRRYELSGDGEPERVIGARVSATLFPSLGVQPLLGRMFTAEDDQPGHDVVILSYELWQRRFGKDPAIVGKVVRIDRTPYSVVGVMPVRFHFPITGPDYSNDPAALWVPMAFTPRELQGWGDMYNNSVLGRLLPGVTLDSARAEAAALSRRIEEHYPPDLMKVFQGAQLNLRVNSYHDEAAGDVRTPLMVLLAAVGLVLLIACANVATLLLSRAVSRQKEIAVRSALGASRFRVLRQLLSENLLLGVAGGMAGWLIAFWGQTWFLSILPSSIPLARETDLGGWVFGFALLVSVASCLIFGAAPALLVWRMDLRSPLHESGRGTTVGRSGRRMQGLFVTAEFALAVILLVGAGLLLRSFAKLLQVDPGFRPDHVLTLSVSLPAQSYPKGSQVRSFYQQVLDRISGLPGVERVAIANDLPLHANETDVIEIEGSGSGPGATPPAIHQTWVLGDYVKTMGIPLIRGRWFTPEDRQGTMSVAIVNATMARDFWPSQDPIGKRIRWGGGEPWRTIVGVVGDVKDSSLRAAPLPHTYTPYQQEKDSSLEETITGYLRSMVLALRTKNDPARLTAATTNQIHSLDPDLALANVHTMEDDLHRSLAPQRFDTFLIGLFAALAVFLAAIGIYGVIAYAVTQQTHDIGVRMALGASTADVFRMVTNQGLRLVLPGVAIGIAGALALTRFLSSLLYGVRATDAATFVGAFLFLTAVAIFASYIPARRATQVDPMLALRYE